MQRPPADRWGASPRASDAARGERGGVRRAQGAAQDSRGRGPRQAATGRTGRPYLSRGSRASRRPSPKRLNPSTVTKMARPGNRESQALAWMKVTLALRSQPQLGVGGWVPSPRKLKEALTVRKARRT